MTIPQKLHRLQKLSGLTQEDLADRLGVTFAAFNRWINGKAQPRPKAQERINGLYWRYVGQKKRQNSAVPRTKTVHAAQSKRDEDDSRYHRSVQTSITNFLYCGNHYLFLKRGPQKRVNPNRLNGIGGRVEQGEDFLSAAIRETEEETGYVVAAKDIRLVGVVRLEGGYTEDWIMCFFKIHVPNMKIPKGNTDDDGTLLWLHKDEVLDSGHEMVDDLQYCFKDIVGGKTVFFMNAQLSDKEKINTMSMGKLLVRSRTC